MKTLEIPSTRDYVTQDLKPLVSLVVNKSLSSALRNRNLVINDIPAAFEVATDADLFSLTLGGIIQTLMTYAADSCIRISAERVVGDMVQINVKDNKSNHPYAITCALQKIVPLAEEAGGHLNITNRGQKTTIISFIFPARNKADACLINLRGAA